MPIRCAMLPLKSESIASGVPGAVQMNKMS
jgi:hypothetical protein